MKKCCVVIITHKDKLNGDEERSFKKALDVFNGKRDIKVVLPDNIQYNYYESYMEKYDFDIIKVKHEWLDTYKAYNKMCCTNEFYRLFNNYEYILIYQTDCWVFEDRLDEFIEKDYDWYGAAWAHQKDSVGNGGFSLRKVSKMLEITSRHDFNFDSVEGAEDTWFCLKYGNEMNICDLNTACNFSIEALNRAYFKKVTTTPMGFHGKAMKRYWDNNGAKFIQGK